MANESYIENDINADGIDYYFSLAHEIKKLFDLSEEKTAEFIAESERVLKALKAEGGDAERVFQYFRRYSNYINSNRGEHFKANTMKIAVNDEVTLYCFRPPCGSNIYVFDSDGKLTFIDTGFAIYADEMEKTFTSLWPDFAARPKRVYITHTDVDHGGLLSKLENTEIFLNEKSAGSLIRQLKGLPDYREYSELTLGYSRISRIITGYTPPDPSLFKIIDGETPEEHDDLLKIGSMPIGSLDFEIYESSGGHLTGETIYVCRECGIIITGDLLVNSEGFSQETAEFNFFGQYLLKSVNTDSKRAAEMRNEILKLAFEIGLKNGKPCTLCCGHGPVSEIAEGRLKALN